jgi:energy-coupling factor transport system permease protein
MNVPVLKTDRDSFWHRRDPRVKVALFAFLIVLIYVAPSWAWMATLVGVGVLLAITARAPWKWLAVMLLIQVPNIIGLVVLPAWEGLSKGEFAFDAEFQFGLRMALGWIAAVLIGVSLISTMEIDELAEGFRGIGLPRRFAFTVSYAFVLVYLSVGDILRIAEAARLKGIELTLRHPVKFVSGVFRLMMPSLFTTVRRGAAMTAALDVRGFSAADAHVRRARYKFDLADASALGVGLMIVGYASAIRAEFVEPVHPVLDTPAVQEKQESDSGAKKSEE